MPITENQILQFLAKRFNPANDPRFIGDDAAVLDAIHRRPLLVSADTLCEGQHFARKTASRRIGRKLASISLSDIAAMGGRPRYLFISLTLPETTKPSWVRSLYRGISEAIHPFEVLLCGGDTVSGPVPVLTSVCLGESIAEKPIYRKGAKAGETIYATGLFGYSYSSGHHLDFTPRNNEIEWLLGRCRLSSLTDASDGLARAIELITLEQKLGADIRCEHIMIRGNRKRSPGTLSRALFDGEDFELVFTAPRIPSKILAQFRKKFNIPINAIGTVSKSAKLRYLCDQKILTLEGKPFAHFKNPRAV